MSKSIGEPSASPRDALIDVCVPETGPKSIARKSALKELLQTDLTRSSCSVFSADPTFSKSDWARDVATQLLPIGVPIFLRHRWMNSVTPLSECALLSMVWGLFTRCVPPWVSELKGKDVSVCFMESWDVDSDDGQDDAAQARPDSDSFDLAAYTRRQRRDAISFARSEPGPRLLICVICCQPQVRMLH